MTDIEREKRRAAWYRRQALRYRGNSHDPCHRCGDIEAADHWFNVAIRNEQRLARVMSIARQLRGTRRRRRSAAPQVVPTLFDLTTRGTHQ